MKAKLIALLIFLVMIGVVGAETTSFKQNELVNYRFRCYDGGGQYCTSGTVLIINVEYPDGGNALDNQTMTYGVTYFNASLPTSRIGDGYKVLIHSPTSNNTITEWYYNVTPTGFAGTIGFYALVLLLSGGVIVLGFGKNDAPIVILGSFGLYFVGLFILLYGIDGIKDNIYTYGIAIIVLALASYISVKSAYELIVD